MSKQRNEYQQYYCSRQDNYGGYDYEGSPRDNYTHTNQNDADLDKKRSGDNNRRQRNQKKFRHPENAKLQNSGYEPYAESSNSANSYTNRYDAGTDKGDSSMSYGHASTTTSEQVAPYDDQAGYKSSYGAYTMEDTHSVSVLLDPRIVSVLLDPRYIVRPSYEHKPGTIFKVLWAEPSGGSKGKAQIPSVDVEIRTFVVIATEQGHSTCVPIMTYGGKACAERGVISEKHGIIHERRSKPKLLAEEPTLGFSPVRAKIAERDEALSSESRVNYSKLMTVEHSLRVFFIGRIFDKDWETVTNAVDTCWKAKRTKQWSAR